MKSAQKASHTSYPLAKLVTLTPRSYASTNIEHDSLDEIHNYIPSVNTLDVIERFSEGLAGSKGGRMISVTGPYGSGKSTMSVFLSNLVSPKKSPEWKMSFDILKHASHDVAKRLVDTRVDSSTHDSGLLKCVVTARREPITATILRALDVGAAKYFGKYSKNHFAKAPNLRNAIKNNVTDAKEIIDILSDLCQTVPVLIIIDEFGKSIEYFATDETRQSDLYLLQEIAEMSRTKKKIPLYLITLQHMSFDEYASGASTLQKREWSKIQGRFEDIVFANSPDQTRLLLSNTIRLNKDNEKRRLVSKWAKKQMRQIQNIDAGITLNSDLIASCYPLEPLALEILPELCSRYGQHERTLLSFVTGVDRNTVATFIENNQWSKDSLPTIGVDVLYDYFISGSTFVHSASPAITRLMEIETIIRDSHGLEKLDVKILKTIGVLNLIGRSGYLRASQNVIEYAAGHNVKQTLSRLEKKSIITYRKHADEYRIWHGTDIDIAAQLDINRKRYQKSSLIDLLQGITPDPIMAARHSMKTGTIRLFERRFIDGTRSEIDISDLYDGIVAYSTEISANFECRKPLITVKASDVSDLRHAAVEVMAISEILQNNKDVTADWVARRELEERLAEAEISLDRKLDNAYGDNAVWKYVNEDKSVRKTGHPSAIVSDICDDAYAKAPRIYNEMINRNMLSSQGTAARRLLIEMMIKNPNMPMFGISGWGPERAVYESIYKRNKIHKDSRHGWMLVDPTGDEIRDGWNMMISQIKKSKNRVNLAAIYSICKMPPFGMKDGVLPLFIVPILLIYKDNVALYEHGTYTPLLTIEVAERMMKNPDHFEIKYFKNTTSRKNLIRMISSDLGLNSDASMLDVVSHLVRTVAVLPSFTKKTKGMDKNTTAVRDAILHAIEPDTLLFESLPKSLGFKPFGTTITDASAKKFSKSLSKSVGIIQECFEKMLAGIKERLFDVTGIADRKKLSKSATIMAESVSDQKMKVFLHSLTSDTLEDENDWMKYVALSLTDVPPTDWGDEQLTMFENKLADISEIFKRLASTHFANISKHLAKSSYQITVTRADGREHRNVVSIKPEQKKKLEDVIQNILRDMDKKGLKKRDIWTLAAMLSMK